MTDRNLEEAIFQLQKLNTENGVKHLVEEAAQLFANGRQIEAGALMEKAEAMMASERGQLLHQKPAATASQPDRPKSEERMKLDEQAMANMAGKLADGLSKILTGAFQELERHFVGESRKINTSFEQQIERLQSSINSLAQFEIKFEHLTESVSQQGLAGTAMAQKYEQVAAAVATLGDTCGRHENEIGAIRGEATALKTETTALRGETTVLRSDAKDFATVIVHQMDGLAARVGLHQEELSGLTSSVSDISRRVSGFIERIDRQGEVLRALNETQVRRAVALDEMLGVLTRMKGPAESVAAMAAGQL
jgi:outer membrane murein-binding lipoprotein Lpp